MSAVQLIDSGRVRISSLIWKTLAVLGLSSLHFMGYLIAYTEKSFSGPWFPFSFKAAPDHAFWTAVVDILGLPLSTIAAVLFSDDSNAFGVAIILNSFLWGYLIFLVSGKVIRRFGRA